MSDARAKLSSPPVRRAQALRNRRIVVMALVLALGLAVIIAWIDGGERAVRPIVEDIAIPAAVDKERG